jgi:ABC-2 type transport system ATP-binding protein
MIQVSGLSKHYREFVAVDDLSFELSKGEILGFLGPNGAGKSTTLRMLTGLVAPTRGSIRIEGYDLATSWFEVKKRLGYSPELPPVYPEMTVREFLRFVARLKGLAKAGAVAEVERVIAALKLESVVSRLVGNLSKGFRQRVGIAQALLGSPPVIILDEPTEGLDPQQRAELRELIRSFAGKHTVVVSSHVLPEIAATCDKALMISRGRQVAFGALADLPKQFGADVSLEETFIRLTS